VDAVGTSVPLSINEASEKAVTNWEIEDDDSGAIYGKWNVTHRACLQTDCSDLEANPTNHKNSKSYLLTLLNPCRERAYSLIGNAGTAA